MSTKKSKQKLSEMNNPTRCVIYCRVSSDRQVKEGAGLESQEKRCRDRASSKGYKVVKVFSEEGISGALFDRPKMKELIDFLAQPTNERCVIIFDDLKRFATDYQVHLRLKLELVKARNAVLECLNFNFEDSPEGEFVEGVVALTSELERKQNSRQVVQKQTARLANGYWPFCPPLGLKHILDKNHGKVLIHRQPFALIFKEALEGFESNLLNTQEEVRLFILDKYKEHGINRALSLDGFELILKSCVYAGFIEYEPWDISKRDGQHEGIISKDTHFNILAKLAGRSKPKLVKSYSKDFPLRGFLTCEECGGKLTASWNSGNGGRYPNYWCKNQECSFKNKVTKAWEIHPQFEAILSTAKAGSDISDLAKAIFSDTWDEEESKEATDIKNILLEVKSVDKQIDNLTERIANTTQENLILTYEKKLSKLAEKQESLELISTKPKLTKDKFRTALNRVYNVLENPLLLWNSDELEDKRTVLWMYFENGLSYHYKDGFGTTNFSSSINLLRNPKLMNSPHVEMRGNEPLSVRANSTPSTDVVHS